MDEIEKIFTDNGGLFVTPIKELKTRASRIKAYIFDWDGVFNTGLKASEEGSPFSEPDSMGLNMLRLNHWIINGSVPPVFIITGENNKTAIRFAQRENLNSVFLSYINKTEALKFICDKYALSFDETAFVFDDILDLGVAAEAGLSFLVSHPGSPLMKDYILKNGLCNYVTGNGGGHEAVREVCELMTGLTGDMAKTIETRIRFEGQYEKYLKERNSIETKVFRYEMH